MRGLRQYSYMGKISRLLRSSKNEYLVNADGINSPGPELTGSGGRVQLRVNYPYALPCANTMQFREVVYCVLFQ